MVIDLKEDNGNGVTWIYHDFKVNGSNDKYRLEIGGGEGPPGANDAMSYHNGAQFSTDDSDNDMNAGHCASGHRTGWWFNKECVQKGALLTGSYTDYRPYAHMQLRWNLGREFSPEGYRHYHDVEMKIRPKSCSSASTCGKS